MRKVFVEPVVLPEPRFRDGLGIRYVRTDGTDDPVEVLRPLWDVGAMQNAIRQRVNRLATFRQARFVPIRAAEVPRDDGSTIEVVSDYVSGHRLSQYLEASQAGMVAVEASTAIHILRELLGALALLHESRGVTHGAIGPERILITPKGRVVVADYVLGPAIERLEFTRPRLWREFRIPLPAGKGMPKLDDKADVLQVGVTALALLLGRPIDLADYPDRVDALVASLSQTHQASGRPPLPAALIGWLRRALLRDPNGKFAHVADARLTLEGVLSRQDAASGGAAALKSMAETFGRYAAELEARAAAAAAEAARRAALAAEAEVREALQEQAADEAAAAPLSGLVPAFTLRSDTQGSPPDGIVGETAPESVPEPDQPVGWRVPEPLPVEETLPTSPLIQIDAPASEPAIEEFVEEVLDLSALAVPDDTDLAAADAALLSENAAITSDEQAEPDAVLANGIDTESVEMVDLRDLAAAEPVPELLEPMPGVGVDVAPAAQDAVEDELVAIETVDAAPAALEIVEMAAAPPFEAEPSTAVESEAGEARETIGLTGESVAPVPSVEVVLAELTALEAPSPAPLPEELPEWRLLADPLGANAPTIDVEEPTESLEELVAEFAATRPIDGASAAAPETPGRLAADPAALIADAPELDLAPALSEEEPVLFVEPPVLVADAPELVLAPALSVEEPPAEVMEAPAPMEMAEEAVPASEPPSVIDEMLGLQESQAAQAAVEPEAEVAATAPDIAAWSFVEELLHHDARFEAPAAADAEPAPQPAVEDAEPALPPDWFIEVGSRPAAEPSVLLSRVELVEVPDTAAEPVAPVPAVEWPPPRIEPAFAEAVALPPVVSRPAPEVPDDDLTGPIFPRVAPSVRRVRAEARRRRLARISSSLGQVLHAFVSACTSGVAALAGGAAQLLSAAGRGTVAGLRAVVTGILAAAAALTRALGGAVRSAATGGAAVVRGGAAAGAAVVRATGAVLGAAVNGAGRGLRALAAGLVALAGTASTAAVAVVRAGGGAIVAFTRGLAAGLGALGRIGSRATVGTARSAAAASVHVGRTFGRAAAAASAGAARAAGLLGRGAALTGSGIRRTAGGAASAASASGALTGRGVVLVATGIGRAAVTIPRKLYFIASDVADRLPKPLFRPWYLAAALVVIVAVAGVPYARARLFTEKPAVGTIRVESARPDAMVTIDGVPHGKAPLTASVPVGRHHIEVASAGQTRAHDIDVADGRETFVQAAGADLKGMGSIRVTTDPAGAEVRIDGVLHGRAPLTVENLAEGAHTILVRDGSGSVRQTVRIREDETYDAAIPLGPGWLAVFAPVKLEVLENGRSIGSTEGGRILTPPGPHTIELVSQALGFRETRQVEIKPGAVAAVTIALPPATIEIVAPAESEILVDGRPVGTAPLGPLEVAVGTREIVMRHPDLGERRQVVSVTYNTPVRVAFE